MNPDEMNGVFEDAERHARDLQQRYSQAAQSFGQISSILSTTKPYWVQLATENTSNASIGPVLESGKANVAEIGHYLASIQPKEIPHLVTISLSASFFGSNTVATSSFVPLIGRTDFRVEAIPIPDYSKGTPLAERFAKLDPALGRVCKEIWEALYGTTADPERTALYMIRQTWDHFFDCLAPDAEVRKSSFWVKKEEPKPDLVTREERYKFAVDRHVRDLKDQALLLASCEPMLELYQELNRAHTRGELNKTKARSSLNTLFSFLEQWADALKI